MKQYAVISSGTDNSGINAAIRAIVRTAASKGARVHGIRWGFRGLLENQISLLTSRDVSGKIGKAGCFLGTNKPEGIDQRAIQTCVNNLKKKNIDGLVLVGGNNSINLTKYIIEAGLPVVAIPSAIQDDVYGTDIALGVDSAVNNIVKYIDKIRGNDSRDRTFIVQVEGRQCGTLAIRSALVSGADFCLVPERPSEDLNSLVKKMQYFTLKGKDQCITIMANGWKPGLDKLVEYLQSKESETDLLVRTSVLGFVQRGGPPTGYDRILGTKMGNAAILNLLEDKSGVMVGIQNNNIVNVPLEDVWGKLKPIDPKMLELFKLTR